MIRRILFDPLHANHNHAKYGMCSLLMVSKNLFQFVQCIFPPETPDETESTKWGVHKDSVQCQKIMDLHLLFTKLFEVFKSRNELNIMSGKSEKTFHDHPNDMSASKMAWCYDGCVFKVHFNVAFEIINMVLSALKQLIALADLIADHEIRLEVCYTCELYKEVLHCLFWDAVFHRRLSELNSKETLTFEQITCMCLLGLDMIANFNVIGFKVTYNMR